MVCGNENEFIGQKAREYLVQSCLDKIVVYSIEVQLCFMSARDNSYVWVSACGNCYTNTLYGSLDFFISRGEFIKDAYGLMGREVSDVQILSDKSLKVCFGERFIILCSDDSDSEIIWSITSDTPAPFERHRFSIDLVEGLEIILKENK